MSIVLPAVDVAQPWHSSVSSSPRSASVPLTAAPSVGVDVNQSFAVPAGRPSCCAGTASGTATGCRSTAPRAPPSRA